MSSDEFREVRRSLESMVSGMYAPPERQTANALCVIAACSAALLPHIVEWLDSQSASERAQEPE